MKRKKKLSVNISVVLHALCLIKTSLPDSNRCMQKFGIWVKFRWDVRWFHILLFLYFCNESIEDEICIFGMISVWEFMFSLCPLKGRVAVNSENSCSINSKRFTVLATVSQHLEGSPILLTKNSRIGSLWSSFLSFDYLLQHNYYTSFTERI